MNKKETMDDLFDEIELDEEDLTKIAHDYLEEPSKKNSEDEEFHNICKKLGEHCKKTWICLPCIAEEQSDETIITKVNYQDILTTSSEDFFNWLCYVWPPAKTSIASFSDYDSIDLRLNTFVNIVATHKNLPLLFRS
jgi:hypothetical protein